LAPKVVASYGSLEVMRCTLEKETCWRLDSYRWPEEPLAEDAIVLPVRVKPREE